MRPYHLLATLLFLACGDNDADLLHGRWRASSVTENGDSLALDPREITFAFTPDGRYEFTSTLGYAEAGTWELRDGLLLAQDTTQPDTPERVVSVETLTADSLVMRMRADSAERYVYLLRQSPPPPQ